MDITTLSAEEILFEVEIHALQHRIDRTLARLAELRELLALFPQN